MTTWTAVQQGGANACGIHDNQIYCWGYNYNGENGFNSHFQNTSPGAIGLPGQF